MLTYNLNIKFKNKKHLFQLCSNTCDLFFCKQVVYSVANEGSRLDIPEGPLGRLISGLTKLFDKKGIVIYCLSFEMTVSNCVLLFAECWAEPQERPSCEEMLSRLLECEDSLSNFQNEESLC